MARGRKAVADTLGEQIEKAQEKLSKQRQHMTMQLMHCRSFLIKETPKEKMNFGMRSSTAANPMMRYCR